MKDLKKSKAVLFVDSKASQSDQTANKQFKEKYAISLKFNDFGLPTEDCMTIYNQTVFDNLDEKFGKQWRMDLKVNPVGFR